MVIRMTTLVCIISAQHVPNLLTVKAIRPDHLFLIITEKMKDNVPRFLNALAAGGLDYSQKFTPIEIQKEHSFDEIISSLKAEYAKDPDRQWVLNITGGTKPMSIGAYMFARENGLRALYVVESDQSCAIDLSGGVSLSLDRLHVTTPEFLAGYGYEIRNPRKLEQMNRQARDLQDLGALLTAHYDDPDIFHFLARLQMMKGPIDDKESKWEKEGITLSQADHIFLKNAEVRRKIAQKFGLAENGSVITGHLDRKAVEFLTGKWLEFFVYGLLKPLEPAYVRCLQSGLSIGLPDAGKNNELDISFMTERSLCMVECKTGSQGHDPDGDQVIYKTEAIKEALGALRVRAFIATTSTNVIDKAGKIKQALANRSQMYGCPIIDGKTLKELAGMYLTGDPALNDKVIDQFNLKESITPA
jgi:hypothetical protein